MHVIFDPATDNWCSFFQSQRGFGAYPYFEGQTAWDQRGLGLGTWIVGLFRYLMPIAREIGAKIGREGLSMGGNILTDLSQGMAVKESVRKNAKQSMTNLASEAKNRFQRGNGRRKPVNRAHSLVGKRLRAVAPKFSSRPKDVFS